MPRPDQPDCCAAPSADPRIARRFDERAFEWADGDELPDLVDVSGALLDLLRDATLRRPRVLELGCGTGGLSVALLEMGAAHATGIDLSPASIDLARRRVAEAGHEERASFEVGDAVEAELAPHDWVVLDRVICCFGDVASLVERAVALAGDRIAISVPESRGWRGLVNRPLWAAEYVWDRFHGGCRGYVHDLRRVERRLADAGFRPTGSERVGLWFIGRYDRPNVAERPSSSARGA